MNEPPPKRKRTILDYFQRNDKGKTTSKMTSEKGKDIKPNIPVDQLDGPQNRSTRSTKAAADRSSTGSKGAEYDPSVYANDSSAAGLGSSVDGKRTNKQAYSTMATSKGPNTSADSYVVAGSSSMAGTSKAADVNPQNGKSKYSEENPGPSEMGDTLQYSPELFTDSEPMDSQELLPDIPERKPSQRQSNCIWRGVPLPTLKRKPGCMKTRYPLHADDKHTVLFKQGFRYNGKTLPTPHPPQYHDKWDWDHVRMPCSHLNEYPVKGKDGKSVVKRRWEIIEQALRGHIPGPFEFEEAILKYNTRYTDKWNFETLRYFFLDEISRDERNQFFNGTLKKIAHLALQLPNLVTHPIPLLKRNRNHSITMSQQQIACLLANAFFCTFPRRNAKQKSSEFSNYPSINFNSLYDGYPVQKKLEKLKCIIHYFTRVTNDMPKGTVTFQRQCIQYEKFPDWNNLEIKLTDLHVSAEGTIEDDGDGLLQVDFANKYLGGGVLGQGCVQEEIRFLICPEMLITRLFTEYLEKNECLLMFGCERFSKYDGYAQSFKWESNFVDKTERDDWGRLCTDVVAIDALVIHHHGRQFKSDLVRRELNKAYCGFVAPNVKSADELNAVCTGNWGCGAFGGDKRLKAMIQLMAASAARRDVCYFTFDDKLLRDELYEIHQYLTQTNRLGIGNILTLIQQYERNVASKESKKSKKTQNLFQYIPRVFDGSLEMTDSEPDTPTRPEFDDSDSNEARYLLAETDSIVDEIKKEEEKGSNSDKPNISRQHSKDYKADTP